MSEFNRTLRTVFTVIIAVSLCFVVLAFIAHIDYKQRMNRKELAEIDQLTRENFVTCVGAARQKLGRLPANMGELNSVLESPLEVVINRKYPVSIAYYRENSDHFLLKYTRFGIGNWRYDSANPDVGWIEQKD